MHADEHSTRTMPIAMIMVHARAHAALNVQEFAAELRDENEALRAQLTFLRAENDLKKNELRRCTEHRWWR